MKPLIVGLGGSLRTPSASLSALQVALDTASTAGADVELLDIRLLDLPLYREPLADRLPGLERLVDLTARADAMIWSSPLYHGTVSGAFKNALDWLQRLGGNDPPFLSGRPIGLIATAAGVQGLQAINTMEHAVRALRGWTVPFVVTIGRSYEAFAADGSPQDLAVARQLTTLGQEVVRAAATFADPVERATEGAR